MNQLDFDYLRALVRRHSAIALEEGKEYLVETRLQSLARTEGIDSVPELMRRIRPDQDHVYC